MQFDFQFWLRILAWFVPSILSCAVGLLMVSIFRQRATKAATTAMWCLIAMLGNTLFGFAFFAILPWIAGMGDGLGANFEALNMAVNLGRQLIDGVALLGLVYAVFQDRLSELDELPELDEWSNPR